MERAHPAGLPNGTHASCEPAQRNARILRAVRKGNSKHDLPVTKALLGTDLWTSELAALEVSDLEVSEHKDWLHVRERKGSKVRDIPLDNKTRRP
jgi:hypothetical protein